MEPNEIVCPFCGQEHEYPEDVKATQICNCGAAWIVEDADNVLFVVESLDAGKQERKMKVIENVNYVNSNENAPIFPERHMVAIFWEASAP